MIYYYFFNLKYVYFWWWQSIYIFKKGLGWLTIAIVQSSCLFCGDKKFLKKRLGFFWSQLSLFLETLYIVCRSSQLYSKKFDYLFYILKSPSFQLSKSSMHPIKEPIVYLYNTSFSEIPTKLADDCLFFYMTVWYSWYPNKIHVILWAHSESRFSGH